MASHSPFCHQFQAILPTSSEPFYLRFRGHVTTSYHEFRIHFVTDLVGNLLTDLEPFWKTNWKAFCPGYHRHEAHCSTKMIVDWMQRLLQTKRRDVLPIK